MWVKKKKRKKDRKGQKKTKKQRVALLATAAGVTCTPMGQTCSVPSCVTAAAATCCLGRAGGTKVPCTSLASFERPFVKVYLPERLAASMERDFWPGTRLPRATTLDEKARLTMLQHAYWSSVAIMAVVGTHCAAAPLQASVVRQQGSKDQSRCACGCRTGFS